MAQLTLRHTEERVMKVIGLIGGMSWNPTLEYYRIMNESIARRWGRMHSARLVLYRLDFSQIERAQHEGRWDEPPFLSRQVVQSNEPAPTSW